MDVWGWNVIGWTGAGHVMFRCFSCHECCFVCCRFLPPFPQWWSIRSKGWLWSSWWKRWSYSSKDLQDLRGTNQNISCWFVSRHVHVLEMSCFSLLKLVSWEYDFNHCVIPCLVQDYFGRCLGLSWFKPGTQLFNWTNWTPTRPL